jgi:hypothetical protein
MISTIDEACEARNASHFEEFYQAIMRQESSSLGKNNEHIMFEGKIQNSS